jgi:hypothetical protein
MNEQPQPTQEEINERIRAKIWDEHASGLDGGDDDDEEDE